MEEVEARLLWPFLEVADHPDLDRQAKATGIARLDLVPPIAYPPIEVDGQPTDWKEYIYGAYSVAKPVPAAPASTAAPEPAPAAESSSS